MQIKPSRAPSLILKVRVFGTRKWPISQPLLHFHTHCWIYLPYTVLRAKVIWKFILINWRLENLLSDIKFIERESALLKHNNKEEKEILPFVTQYQPSVSTLKEVLMKKWNFIQNQPLLRQIFKEPPIISNKKGKSLRDMLVRAKI